MAVRRTPGSRQRAYNGFMEDAKYTSTDDLARRAGVRSDDLRAIIEALVEELAAGNEVNLSGLGRLVPRTQPERHLNTSVAPGLVIPPMRVVTFRMAKGLKATMNP